MSFGSKKYKYEVGAHEDVTVSQLLLTINPNSYDIDPKRLAKFNNFIAENIYAFLVVKNAGGVTDISPKRALKEKIIRRFRIEKGKDRGLIHSHMNIYCLTKSKYGYMNLNMPLIRDQAKKYLGSGTYCGARHIKNSNKSYNYITKN